MRAFRTLYAKIFGWFWLTLIVGALLVLAVTAFTGSQPLGRRWMRLTQDMYAHSAVDFYETGGAPALRQYLTTLRDSSGMQASLLDEYQQDVLGGTPPPNVGRVLQQSIRTGKSNFHLGRIWTAATPVSYGPRRFFFVIEVRPLRGFFDGTFAIPALNRLMLALLVAGIFCFILTRHIVAPVRALQGASLRLAAGDLGTRVFPAIAPRDDELADTAKAFDQMADRIQHLIQKRQELLADISHELRSPLTRLSVSLELMRRGETDVLEQMQVDLDRMNAMIGQILLLTRLDLQPSRTSLGRVELKSILQSIANDAEFEVQGEDKTVLLRVEGNCSVRGDANLLRSCIENIVRNAVHYTVSHSTVEMTARTLIDPTGRSQCEIVVADSGPGVPEASLPLLFDPFYRVSESREQQEGGTGLGLSISQKIVSLHDGTIQAANRNDAKGLMVRLLLPSA
jgi:two-component system sensor histidine kinase CpxA